MSSASIWPDGSSRPPSRGDLAGLEALLADDVQLTADGGGKAPALARSLKGRDRVSRALVGWVRRVSRVAGVSWRPAQLNENPGAVLLDATGRVIGVCALDIVDGRIAAVYGIVNPDKLTHLGPAGNLGSLFGGPLCR